MFFITRLRQKLTKTRIANVFLMLVAGWLVLNKRPSVSCEASVLSGSRAVRCV